MNEIKEYVVTLHNKDDLDEFYKDMETLRATKYNCMPERTVECALRREISRNTHYWMTEEEAIVLRQDPRVLAVELKPAELGIFPRPMFTQTESNWNKNSTNTNTHKNWGLLRVVEGSQRTNWGSNGTTNQSGTIQVNAEGRNVDVVIVDGMIDPTHPELAVNSDGTGGSKIIQYNWFQHSLGQASGTYVYEPYVDGSNQDRTDDNNHGSHVAGTVAGNTQGWARKANIYNINPYGTDVNLTNPELLIDYIRQFHATKPVNPNTGRRNPTICNHSWGFGSVLSISNITSVTFRGETFSGPFTEAQLNSYGIFTANVGGTISAIRPARVPAVDADMIDAMAEGIIMVGAAGNDFTKVDVPGGQDFNNTFVWSGFTVPYHRGSSPTAAPGCISVGALSTLVNESKATFSNCGPGVDIYAPGVSIMSSLNTTSAAWPGTTDSRNSSYRIGKASGTSMASPQVCGVLATVLEIYPNFTQTEAKEYLLAYAKNNQITDTGGGFTDYTSLQGSANKYLFYYKERPDVGSVFPKLNFRPRPSSGAVYPRLRRS